MRLKLISILPWVSESLCGLVACKSTCYDDCKDCRLRDANQPSLEIRLRLSPADGSDEEREFLKRLKSFLGDLNRNGEPEKEIQMTLFPKEPG